MPTSKEKIILGIDPGIAITGYGIVKFHKKEIFMIKCGAIITNAKEIFGFRLNKLHLELNKIIKKYKPDEIAVEKLFFAKNAKTALKVGEARGVINLTIWKNKKKLREFTPLQVKLALTGYGRASKKQIQIMVKQQLNLKEEPKPDDVADALAIAICSAYTKEY
ncbi:MAG: crossover junction endodeoxyribonuclease RuvC [bacterium]|nr:crossover junction endodeoxyribonuclease RuvC [bacterium]